MDTAQIAEALAPYGASITAEGFIAKGERVTSVKINAAGKRIRIEGGDRLLASGPQATKTIENFVERFWFWKKN